MSKSEIPNKINIDYFKIGIEVGTDVLGPRADCSLLYIC